MRVRHAHMYICIYIYICIHMYIYSIYIYTSCGNIKNRSELLEWGLSSCFVGCHEDFSEDMEPESQALDTSECRDTNK